MILHSINNINPKKGDPIDSSEEGDNQDQDILKQVPKISKYNPSRILSTRLQPPTYSKHSTPNASQNTSNKNSRESSKLPKRLKSPVLSKDETKLNHFKPKNIDKSPGDDSAQDFMKIVFKANNYLEVNAANKLDSQSDASNEKAFSFFKKLSSNKKNSNQSGRPDLFEQDSIGLGNQISFNPNQYGKRANQDITVSKAGQPDKLINLFENGEEDPSFQFETLENEQDVDQEPIRMKNSAGWISFPHDNQIQLKERIGGEEDQELDENQAYMMAGLEVQRNSDEIQINPIKTSNLFTKNEIDDKSTDPLERMLSKRGQDNSTKKPFIDFGYMEDEDAKKLGSRKSILKHISIVEEDNDMPVQNKFRNVLFQGVLSKLGANNGKKSSKLNNDGQEYEESDPIDTEDLSDYTTDDLDVNHLYRSNSKKGTKAEEVKQRRRLVAYDILSNVFFGLKKKKQAGGNSLIVNYKTQIEAPNPQRLIGFMNNYYVRIKKVDANGEETFQQPTLWYSAFKLPNGSIFFCKKKQETKFDLSGPGIPLYFIFLKTIIVFMILASICSIYMVAVNVQTKKNYEATNSTSASTGFMNTFGNNLLASSIATVISLSREKVYFSLQTLNKQLYFQCKSGTISTDLTKVKMGHIAYYRDAEEVENIWNSECSDLLGLMTSIQKCSGKNECEIVYKRYWYKEECWKLLGIPRDSNLEDLNSDYNGYLSLPCINATTNPNEPGNSIFHGYRGYILLAYGITIVFELFSVWLYLNESYFDKQYKLHYRTPDEYVLQLRNFPTHLNEVELCKYILQMFDRLAEKYNFPANPIIDLNLIKSRRYLMYVAQIELQSLKLAKVLLKYKQNRKTKFDRSQMDVEQEIYKINERIINCDEPREEKRLRVQLALLHQIKEEQEKVNKIKELMYTESLQKSRIECLFVTFQRIKDRKFFLELLSHTYNHYLSYFSKTMEESLLKEDKLIYATEPAIPLNMKWHNYTYSSTDKFLRRLFSWVLYIILYLIPVYLLFRVASYKQELRKDFSECKNTILFDSDKGLDFKEFFQEKKFTDLELGCYCIESSEFMLNSVLLKSLGKAENFCQIIKQARQKFETIVTIESILISVLTFIFDIVYMWLTSIEAHNDRNTKKVSFIFKLFCWKFFINGIMPVLSNVYLFYFGRNDDFSENWFQQKGLGVMITSIVRIFALISVGIIRFIAPRLKQFYDAKFSFDINKTRKETHQEYQKEYTNMEFDLELSFSESLTTIFVMLSYGYMMPIIIPASLLQLIVIFFRDKLLVSNTYIFFSFIGIGLHTYIRKTLVMAFFISCFVNIWVFGNYNAFTEHEDAPERNSALNFFDFVENESGTNYTVVAKSSGILNSEKVYLEGLNLAKSGYGANFSLRSNSGAIQRALWLVVISYAAFTFIRLTLFPIISAKIAKNRLTKGIKNFQSNDSNSQFEDLIDEAEILERITLEEKALGRDIPLIRLRELNRNKRQRLARNFQRRKQKKLMRQKNKQGTKFGLQPSQTIASNHSLANFNAMQTLKTINDTSIRNLQIEKNAEILEGSVESPKKKNPKKILGFGAMLSQATIKLGKSKVGEKDTKLDSKNASSPIGDASPLNRVKNKLKMMNMLSLNTPQNDASNTPINTANTHNTVFDTFFTLSSYDFRLNPRFKDYFVGEVNQEFVDKYLKKDQYELEKNHQYKNMSSKHVRTTTNFSKLSNSVINKV